ncbi:hypothetical protein EYF80_055743 [Liparis tanakae]|uniref:Uncharacterized protein n=1 Tax=Liparis tanakae TaxID=230148 RepID=A0A4Z2F0S6_9TELE|nr:hypothetical protein EYF80_055743 [Liparis tanakae]
MYPEYHCAPLEGRPSRFSFPPPLNQPLIIIELDAPDPELKPSSRGSLPPSLGPAAWTRKSDSGGKLKAPRRRSKPERRLSFGAS